MALFNESLHPFTTQESLPDFVPGNFAKTYRENYAGLVRHIDRLGHYPFSGNYLSPWGRTHDIAVANLAHCGLPLERFGVSHEPIHSLSRTDPQAEGFVFPKEGQRFSADYIFYRQFEVSDYRVGLLENADRPTLISYPWRMHLAIVADGATPILPIDALPLEVTQLATFRRNGNTSCRPDILWSTALGAVLGDFSYPTPNEFRSLFRGDGGSASSKLVSRCERMLLGCVRRQGSARDIAREIVINFINPGLLEWMQLIFKDYSKQNFECYPSGVVGVVVAIEPASDFARSGLERAEDRSWLNGFCSTGDISITSAEPGQPFRRNNRTDIVNLHDILRTGLPLPSDSTQLRGIARYRAPFLGNLPLPPEYLQFASSLGGLTDGSLWRSLSGEAMLLTDGLQRYPLHHQAFSLDTYISEVDPLMPGEVDPSAAAYANDFWLALLGTRFIYNMRNRRPDDGAILVMSTHQELSTFNFGAARSPLLVDSR